LPPPPWYIALAEPHTREAGACQAIGSSNSDDDEQGSIANLSPAAADRVIRDRSFASATEHLKQSGWILKRTTTHEFYERWVKMLPEEEEFDVGMRLKVKVVRQGWSRSCTPSDRRSAANELADLRRMDKCVLAVVKPGEDLEEQSFESLQVQSRCLIEHAQCVRLLTALTVASLQ
jgi:hypothetical protein